MLSEEQFSQLYEKLTDAFGQYSKNPTRTLATYYDNLKNTSWETMNQTVSHAVKTCKRFPSIAELRDISQQFNPETSSTNTTITNDVADFKRRMRICNDITSAIQKLPDFQRRAIENKANDTLKANAPDWYTTEMKKRAFMGFCILAFKELHPESAADIEQGQHKTHNNNEIAPYRPIPFQIPASKTTMWPSQPTQIVDMDVM